MDVRFRRLVLMSLSTLVLALAPHVETRVAGQERRPTAKTPTQLFFDAIKEGKIDQVQASIDEGIDVNERGYDKMPPLVWAAEHKRGDVIRLLIGKGADVNAAHYLRGTALHVAASRDLPDAVRDLLKAGADVNSDASRYGPTPLHCAAGANNAEIVKLLIEAGATIDSDGMTPLTSACRTAKGDDTAAIKLLIDAGASLNPKGDSPLHWARCPAVTKLLIAAGGDVNHRNKTGQTPLHLGHAPHWGPREDELKLMIDAGADVNALDADKSTPLHQAVQHDFPKVVKVLIAAGANVNARDAGGNTPLSLAHLVKSAEIVTLLKAAGADDGQTPLGRAAVKGDVKQVQALLASGAAVDELGSEKKTALHLACEHDQWDVVQVLIAAKADVNRRAIQELTPLHLVRSKRIAQALLDAGAEVQPKPESMLGTPLFVAATEGRAEIVELLVDQGKCPIPKDLVVWVTFYGRDDVLQSLLNRGASANGRLSSVGLSPLIVATSAALADVGCPEHVTPEVRLKMAKQLLKSGARVNDRFTSGYFDKFTALHAAASQGEVEMIKLLLEHKGDVRAAGAGEYFAGVTPLHLAARGGHLDAVKTLLAAGADVNAVTGNTKLDGSRTPLDFAKSAAVSDLLIEKGGKVAGTR